MIPFTFLFRDEKQKAALLALSREKGKSNNELIRQAVDSLLDKPDRAVPRKSKGE